MMNLGQTYWICITSCLEVCIGVTCSSAASLKPFFSHFFGRDRINRGSRKYRLASKTSSKTLDSESQELSKTPDSSEAQFQNDELLVILKNTSITVLLEDK